MRNFPAIAILALATGCASTGTQDYARSEARAAATVIGAVAVVQPGIRGFEPGPRVRVLTGPKGSRVEQS